MPYWNEEGFAELEEKVVLAELLKIKEIFISYLENVRTQPYIRGFADQIKELFRDAAKHNPLVATHSRKALQHIREHRGTNQPYSQQISFMTKEEDAVIRATMNIESAIFILENQFDHLFNMDIQHESHLGQPRQSGYTPSLLRKQAQFIVKELDKVINAVRGLIQIEEALKKQW